MANYTAEMPFLEHVKELRNRIIYSIIALVVCTTVTLIFYEEIISFLKKPLAEHQLFVKTIFEGFIMRIKISLFAALILSSPVFIYNILRFVFPGLRSKEKKILIYSLISSMGLLLVSFWLSYYRLIPFSVKFLMSPVFLPSGTGQVLSYEKTVMVIFQFILIALLIFQLPIVLMLMMYMNLLQRKTLLGLSRYVIVGIFIMSAVLTPPDIISQVGIALPLIALYFLTILLAKILRFGEQ